VPSREKFDNLFNKYVRPKLLKDRITITFPEPFCLANPLAMMLLKIINDNHDFQILTPKDFDGFDVTSEYGALIGYKRDFGQIAYLFVEDKPVFVDYKDNSWINHSAVGRLIRYTGPNTVDAAIKFQFAPKNYPNCPFPIIPFIYPGPNDFIELTGYVKYYDEKYSENFKKCCEENSFTSSIFARWNNFNSRVLFIPLCEKIPNHDVLPNNRLGITEYMERMSTSRFTLAARGNGKLSHREMEACAIGLPLLRQNTGELMWHPFVPDKHYIAVEADNFIEKFNYYNNHYDEALEIAHNGKQYYEENHTQRGVQKIFKEIVDVILGRSKWTQA
jgi:hypothetical protein